MVNGHYLIPIHGQWSFPIPYTWPSSVSCKIFMYMHLICPQLLALIINLFPWPWFISYTHDQKCGSGLIVSRSRWKKYKIWWIWIRIQSGSRSIKSSLISKHLLKVKKKSIFKSKPKTLEISSHEENVGDVVLRFRLEKYKFLWNLFLLLIILCFFPFTIYLWIRIPGPKWIRIHTTAHDRFLLKKWPCTSR